MDRALLSSSTIAITPRCESGYPSSPPSLINNRLCSIPLLLRMEEKGRPEHTPMIQAILRMLHEGYAPQGSANPQDRQIELSLFNPLQSLRNKNNFDHFISNSNDSSPTLTHLPALCGYMSLMRHLFMRRIDLSVTDISGLIALHCAYLKEEREIIRIPLRGGALSSIQVKLGRSPRTLLHEGSYLADWLDGEIRRGDGSPLIEHPMGHEIALEELFTALESEREHENDSGHGGSDFGSDASNKNDDAEEGMNIGSPTLDPGPSVSTLYVLWSYVSWLVLSCLVFSYFRFPLRLFHSLVPQPVM